MFTNIGSKLKTTAKVLCWAGILLSAVFGVFMIIRGNELMQVSDTRETGLDMLVTGITVLVFGPVFSWVWGLLLSVFGELADRVTGIEAGVREICADLNTFPAAPEKAPEAPPEEAAKAGAGTETETAGTGTAPAGAQEGGADQHAADHEAEETMERFGGFQFPHPVPQPGNRVSAFSSSIADRQSFFKEQY